MSSLLITKIGLPKRDQGSLLSQMLSSSTVTFSSFFMKFFSASAFANITPKHSLFPQISKSNVSNFRNTLRGLAVACAADDLELTFGGEDGQIEIFDNIGQSNPQQFRHDPMQFGMGKAGLNSAHFPNFDKPTQLDLPSYESNRFGIDDYSPNSFSSGQSRFPFEHSQFDRAIPDRSYGVENPEFGFDFMSSHQSHFDIMSNNIQLDTQFTDFKPSSFNDSSSYGSSVESFDSPMDEMFISARPSIGFNDVFPRKDSVSSRKRKLDSPDTSSFDIASDNVFFKNDTVDYEGQKRVKRESVAKTEPVKTDFVDLHTEIFLGPANMRFGPAKEVGIQGKSLKFDEDMSKARYRCKDCDAAFKVKSYLTRHMKKHNNAKAFVCPFYREQDSEYCGTNKAGTKCHPTGGFSRKDTYKTHLKALHFIYPPRTKSSERGTQGGRCAGCFQYFESNIDWFTNHIEGGSCKGFVDTDSAEESTDVKVKQEMLD